MDGFVVGLEGGATTEYVICTPEGDRISGGRLGALGPLASHGAAAATARELARLVRECEGRCIVTSVAVEGADDGDTAERMREMIARAGLGCDMIIRSFWENALYTAFGDGDGAALVSGADSICFGRRAGEVFRSGGRGRVIDDGGSGYAIGRDMLSAVMRASDGRESETALTRLVGDFYGTGDIAQLSARFTDVTASQTDIAALSSLLSTATRSGDEAAKRVEERAAQELASLATAVLEKIAPVERVSFGGTVLTGSRMLRGRVTELISERFPRAECSVCYTRGAEGAAQYAIEALRLAE